MTFATVRNAAQHVARVGSITPHQLAALTALDESLTTAQRQQFTELWRAEGSPAAAADPAWLAPALKIIKEFEGCRLNAYRDSVGVPTIGWGTTRYPAPGGAVKMGDTITQQRADELLRRDLLELRGPGVFHLLPQAVTWPPNRIAALVSFAYNLGLGALERSTLRKRLLMDEDPVKVVEEELPRWTKADNSVLAGLVRRRAAEVALFKAGTMPLQQQTAPVTPGRVTPTSPFSARLTPHIRVGEFALDQEARRFQHQHQVDTAAELAAFLERVRSQFGGRPIIITSGYRPPAVNRSVGGATNSEHLFNSPGVGAVDFYVKGYDTTAVQTWCDRNWSFSLGYAAHKGYIHLGIRAGRPRVRWGY